MPKAVSIFKASVQQNMSNISIHYIYLKYMRVVIGFVLVLHISVIPITGHFEYVLLDNHAILSVMFAAYKPVLLM